MSTLPLAPAGPSGPAGAAAAGDPGTPVPVTVAGTEPYPWPWDGRFAPQRCALLIVGDGTPIGDPAVAALVRELTARSLATGILVVQVTAWRPRSRPGPALPSAQAPGPVPASWAGPSVTSAGWDGFYGSPLDSLLRAAGRDQLLLTGRLLEVGVHSTLRSANDRGYECLTIGDACEAGTAQTRDGGLSSITMSGGIFGAIGTSPAVLDVLAATPTRQDSTEEELA